MQGGGPRFSDLSAAAFAELRVAVTAVETLLRRAVGYEKINYLMLMMLDPDVHFHVTPRNSGARSHEDQEFPDAGWPGPPALTSAVDLGAAGAARLAEALRREWPEA